LKMKKSLLLLFISTALVHTLSAQIPGVPPGGAGAGGARGRQGGGAQMNIGHFYGRIIDKATNKGLEAASVQLIQNRFDTAFQGYGRTAVDDRGGYRFRTIRPVPYPGRTPHIHVAVYAPGQGRFITQMYVEGEPLNARDGILNGIRNQAARQSVIVRLDPAPELEPQALKGMFDIVLDL